MKLNNTYYILRHGEALSNTKDIMSCWPEKFYNPLTSKGKKEVGKSAKKLKNKNIDFIFSSDLLRTKQTAEIISREIKSKIRYDKRIREQGVGVFNNKPEGELRQFLPSRGIKRFNFRNSRSGVENYNKIQKRMHDFLKEINKKYKNKNILIISHQLPLSLLEIKIKGIANKDFYKKLPSEKRIKTGELRLLTEY